MELHSHKLRSLLENWHDVNICNMFGSNIYNNIRIFRYEIQSLTRLNDDSLKESYVVPRVFCHPYFPRQKTPSTNKGSFKEPQVVPVVLCCPWFSHT